MPEEFVDDIIAANSPAESQETQQQPAEEPKEDVVNNDSDDTESSDEQEAVNNDTSAEAPTIEGLATQLGWKPDHEGDDFVDAATYILRSREIQDSMRDHNKDLKSQLSALQGSVDALKEHNERVYKADLARKQAEIDRLRKEKRAAIELADVDKVEDLEKEITGLEQDLHSPAPKQTTTNPIYDEWVKDNQWYLTDNEMAAYADQVAQQYAGAPLPRLYALVRNKVAEVFPEKFESAQPAQTQPRGLANPGGKPASGKPKAVGPSSPVEGGKKTSASPSFTKADLTPDQLSIMSQFVKSGIMTEEQYIKDLAKMQEA